MIRINSVTFEEIDTKMLSLNWGIFLEDISKMRITVSASAGTGDPLIRGFTARVESQSYSKKISSPTRNFNGYIDTQTVTSSGTRQARITLLLSSSQVPIYGDYPYTVVSYSKPQIIEATAKRVNSSNVEDENGTYLNITFKGTIDSVGNRNKNIFKIGYKEKGSSGDYTYKILVNDDKSTYTLNYENYRFTDISLDTTKNYEIAFFAIDEFKTINSTRDILLGFDLLNFNSSGKSMAIGTISTRGANEECLDIALDTYFNENITTKGSDINLGSISGTNDSGDIVFRYGDGDEKSRIWMDNTLNNLTCLPMFRSYDISGNQICGGRMLLNTPIRLTDENILELEPGFYFKEDASGWTENGWPAVFWHATLTVLGYGSGTGYGYRTLICVDNANNELWIRSQQWGNWSSWKKIA